MSLFDVETLKALLRSLCVNLPTLYRLINRFHIENKDLWILENKERQNYNTHHPLNIIMVPYGDDSILSWWHIVMT